MDITSEQEKMLEAINIAIEMELDGKDCYLTASKDSKNEAGKKLLLALAEEENGHLLKFKELYDTIMKGHGWPFIKPESNNISGIRDNLAKTCQLLGVSVDGGTREIEALQIAIDKEKKSYEFYKNQASKAVYDIEKEFYISIANEEWEHELALFDYHDFLSDPASWYLNAEHPSLDGG